MKYAIQNTNDQVIICAVTTARDEGENGYYEQVAIGYNTRADNYEAVILSRGNGCGDDRVLCDNDDDETISPDTLRDAGTQIREMAAGHPHETELHELADYIEAQAEYLESI